MIPHDLFVGEKKGKVGVTLIRHWLMEKKKKKPIILYALDSDAISRIIIILLNNIYYQNGK